MRRSFLLLFLLAIMAAAHAGAPQWLTLPATPTLPQPARSGLAPVNNVKIWFAEYGQGEPLILLHGGLANANYWGNQVPELAKSYRVIVMDSRGHGRSTRDSRPFGYDLMASDVLALMDYLEITKAAIVGWSDGAILGLDIAINHPDRITKLFAFAANSDPSGVNWTPSPVFNQFIARAKTEYEQLSPTPEAYKSFLDQISAMWAAEPNFTAEELHSIKIPVLIVDADHDEAIKRENTEFMASEIPNAGLLLLPGVSHFALLQDPGQFNCNLQHFLQHAWLRP
jgi:pimeloyl-ACP methyl ester carboxylesterase